MLDLKVRNFHLMFCANFLFYFDKYQFRRAYSRFTLTLT